MDVASGIQREKKALLEGGDRRSAAFYLCVPVFRRSHEGGRESVVPRTQLN